MLLKRFAVSSLVLSALSGFSWSAVDYHLDPGWSHIEFSVKNFGIHTVEGRFTSFSGTVSLDDADVTRSSVSVSILAASVDTDSAARDKHLRTADFFDVAKTSEITFYSERIVKTADGYVMTGPLTIKGRTQPVDFKFTFTKGQTPEGKPILQGQATGVINRHDFGLDYGSNFSIGKEVAIRIHIQATP